VVTNLDRSTDRHTSLSAFILFFLSFFLSFVVEEARQPIRREGGRVCLVQHYITHLNGPLAVCVDRENYKVS
jgi:hypothetical protein